ncbi:MAG TPA: TA system VapC family ribonuclease toxin [Vicinamibacteria bacterium]|nr:TA system VapC family ribonuclease toxin [Vicinamibacteria bacterium]
MLAVDSNVLVYAHRREVSEHEAAGELLRQLAEGSQPWAIPWPCVYEFFSVVTNPRIWKEAASSPGQAWSQLDAWLGSPTLRLLGETQGFDALLARFLTLPRVRGPVVHDARVAALCVAHGVEALLTRDRDFSLFAELRTRDPLA